MTRPPEGPSPLGVGIGIAVAIAVGIGIAVDARSLKRSPTRVCTICLEVKRTHRFTLIVERDPESGWLVGEVVELTGCHCQAKNMTDLEKNMREAIPVYLETAGDETPYPEFVGLQQIEAAVRTTISSIKTSMIRIRLNSARAWNMIESKGLLLHFTGTCPTKDGRSIRQDGR
ncbi:MAG: type II toxin-antitoxin system HicB family antitoxin [Acidobacteria bacterium]|nr:type II toxin-antitoxin system HicB family antitoxin [Acidobacteriota bacterium]